MKAFTLSSSLFAMLASAQSVAFQEGKGANGASGQFVRLSKASSKDVLPTDAPIKYKLTTWGVYYEDTGVQAVRLMAELTADIFATDVVTFEVNFRPKNQGNAMDTNSIGEDTVSCEMTRKTSDGAFWSANIVDAYVTCKGTQVSDVCAPTGAEKAFYKDESTKYTETPEPQSDWKTPFDDDDPDNFWCTKKNTVAGAALDPFECSKLRCYMERPLVTTDATKDLWFTPKAGTPDVMVIKQGRAKVYINKKQANFVDAAMNDWQATDIELSVPLAASTLFKASLTVAAASLITLAF